MDAAGQIDTVFKAFRLEKLEDLHTAHSVVAEDDEGPLSGERFKVLGDLAHRDVERALDPANSQFGILPDVEKDGLRIRFA